MAKRNGTTGSPLSFEIEDALYQQLLDIQKTANGVPVSVLIEYALKQHDASKVAPRRGARRQLSVRLPDTMRKTLEKHSRAKKVSMALLIREALEALVQAPPQGEELNQIKETMPPSKKAAKKATKKAAKKAAAKKSARKGVSKKAARKGAVKATVKKAAAKKATKKAVTKKTAAKKAGKKAAKKVTKKAAKKATKKAAANAVKSPATKTMKRAAKKATRKRAIKG